MKDYHDFLRSRRSVRRFKANPVPVSVIERIITTATFAPSAHHLQPWRFVIISTESAKAELGKALTTKLRKDMTVEGTRQVDIDKRITISLRRIKEAPVIILLLRDETAVHKDEPEEYIMSVQSVALSGLQLMLAAHAEGLGTNWICWPLYAPNSVRNALNLPENWEPQGMFFLGFPDEEPITKREKPIILYR